MFFLSLFELIKLRLITVYKQKTEIILKFKTKLLPNSIKIMNSTKAHYLEMGSNFFPPIPPNPSNCPFHCGQWKTIAR